MTNAESPAVAPQRRDDGPEADRAADVQRHDDDRAAAAGSQPEEAAEQHLQSFVVLYRADDGPVGRVLEQTEGQYRYRDERAHLNVAVRSDARRTSSSSFTASHSRFGRSAPKD